MRNIVHEDLRSARWHVDRGLIRALSTRYRRDQDLTIVLSDAAKDYELEDRHCRWITASLMHRLCRLLRRTRLDRPSHPSDRTLTWILVRACLRGEARRYRQQTLERRRTTAVHQSDMAKAPDRPAPTRVTSC